jgi:RNA polymerase sigma-70 factor, ECF subfamily
MLPIMDGLASTRATDAGPAATGSPQAGAPIRDFEAFFVSERLRLYRALVLLTADRAEAEDIMQEAFVRLWERWDRVGAMEDPVGYLYRTALNGFRARLRRTAAAARRRFRLGAAVDPFEHVEDRDTLARVLKAATVRQRTAVVLTEVLALTSKEAARLMGVSAVTVRRLAGKGRDAMRRSLEERHE